MFDIIHVKYYDFCFMALRQKHSCFPSGKALSMSFGCFLTFYSQKLRKMRIIKNSKVPLNHNRLTISLEWKIT